MPSIDPNTYSGISAQPDENGVRHLNMLPETENWEPAIYQVESGDSITGGPNGLANLQINQLANRTAWLKKNAGDNKAFRQLQHVVNDLIMSFEITSTSPSGYDGMFVENFDEVETEVDTTRYDIISISSDKRTIEIGAADIVVGGTYQIGDGIRHEEFQVVSSTILQNGSMHIWLKEPLNADYDVKTAKIARTSVNIDIGRAYGGDITSTEVTTDLPYSLQQKDRPEITASVPFQNPRLFDLEDAVIVNDIAVPSKGYTKTIGFTMVSPGNQFGTWKQLDAFGNDLMDLLDEVDKEIWPELPKYYGIVNETNGGSNGYWKRIDNDGNDLIELLYPEDPNAKVFGVTLFQNGNVTGDWRHVDGDGNDLMQRFDEEAPKDPSQVAYGFVLNSAGNRIGDWKQVDKEGNDLVQKLEDDDIKDPK